MRRRGVLYETDIQQSVIKWWAYAWRGLGAPCENRLFAVPNGGSRHVFEAAKLKREGVRSGVADLLLLCPRAAFHGLIIEMKRPGGRVTIEQADFLHGLAAEGYACKVCFSFDEAQATIAGYMKLGR